MVWEWTKSQGPMSGWSAAFMAEFEEAEQNGMVGDCAQEWAAHREVGKALVRDLHGIIEGRLPRDEASLRDTLQQVINLISTLSAGIAAVDAYLAALGL
jgi:hypothetical protein